MGRASAHIRIGQLAQPGQVPFHQPRSQEKEGGEGKERRGEGRRERRGRGGEEEQTHSRGSPLPTPPVVLHNRHRKCLGKPSTRRVNGTPHRAGEEGKEREREGTRRGRESQERKRERGRRRAPLTARKAPQGSSAKDFGSSSHLALYLPPFQSAVPGEHSSPPQAASTRGTEAPQPRSQNASAHCGPTVH